MSVVDPAPAAYPYRYDPRLDSWEVGAPWLSLHGLPPRRPFTTEDLLLRVHPDDLRATRDWLQEQVARPGTSSHTYRMRTGQRSGRRVRLVAHAVRDRAQRTSRLDGFLLDITGDISRWQTEAVTASATYRATIEQAKGALMLAFCVDEETAFRMLVAYSQGRNAKLRDVAAFITEAIKDPRLAHPDHPVESLVDVITLLADEHTRLQPAAAGAPGASPWVTVDGRSPARRG
ncbi:hypothetical protein GCM10027517_08430 [Phycicoccus ginsengisoli]